MGDHWKSLANKLGAPGINAPATERTVSEEPAKAAAPEPAPSVQDPATRLPSSTAPVTLQPEPPVAAAPEIEVPARKDKTKRKSSWDTLTSFFGISSAEAPTEVSSAAPAETDSLSATPAPAEPASFQRRETETSKGSAKPTALDELFGSAPRQEITWEKPAPRRMVDDVSGWSDDDEPAVEPTLDDQADTFTPAAEELDATEAREGTTKRRRRRRRGSRRDRDSRPEGETRSRSARADVEPIRDDADPWVEDLLEAEVDAGDDWTEPTSFAPARDIDDIGDSDEPMPERRSSRRRRRGRGRSDVTADSPAPLAEESSADARPSRDPHPAREPRPRREAAEARPERPVREPRGSVSEDSAGEPARREARPPRDREGRSAREGRENRPPRQRPVRPSSETTNRDAVAAVDDVEDQVDSSLAAELEGEPGSGNRHPKIPTWADSLEAIIAANMDNHRRNEHRGGPPRGGRPRGNGGGQNRR